MKNLLITGSTGFIGSNILNSLLKNYNIFVTSRRKSFKQKNVTKIYFKNHDDLTYFFDGFGVRFGTHVGAMLGAKLVQNPA